MCRPIVLQTFRRRHFLSREGENYNEPRLFVFRYGETDATSPWNQGLRLRQAISFLRAKKVFFLVNI